MAWIAIFQDAVQRDGYWAYSIVYTDGAQKVLREYVADALDDAAVLSAAMAEVARLSSASAPQSKFSIQIGQQLDLTYLAPAPAPAPSQADQARDAFLVDWRLYQRYQRAVTAGLIASDDKRVTDLTAKIKGEWLDAYMDVL